MKALIKAGILIGLLSIFLSFLNCALKPKNDLIVLKNEHIEVGILPEVGGRVVLLRKPGLNNILKSDEKLWVDSGKQKPAISAFSDFKAFNGHIVWVGPQSEWWTHQDINTSLRDSKADWPPDPYLIYGKFEVVERRDDYLKIAGPESPVSGVRLTKEISIDSTGKVLFTVTAENIRKENVGWDLWMNTRLDGFAKVYVPFDSVLQLVKSENQTAEVTPYEIIDGYLTLNPSVPAKPKTVQVQEFHLIPTAGLIAGFDQGQALFIRFDLPDIGLIHPYHGPVELYSYVNDKGDDALLELEVHSAYHTLSPGDTMSFQEKWEVREYLGDSDLDSHIRFLTQHCR